MEHKSISKSDVDKVVFLSDVHLGIRNASIEWADNIVNYFDNFFIPKLKEYIEKHKKVLLIIAGDFFDNRQSIDINIMNIGADIMEKLSKLVEVMMIIGNHDIYKKKDINITSLRLFKYFKNVTIVNKVTVLTVKKGKKFLLVPWIGNSKEETEIITKYNSSVDFVVLHTDIAGLKYDNGRQIMNGVNISAFEGTMIYSGHIHKKQIDDKGRVTYLGTPYQLRRSDIGNSKGVFSLNIGDDKNVIQEYVDNDYSPKFLKLNLEFILEKTVSEIKLITENNYVDIIVSKKYMNDINVSKLMEVLESCNTRKIEIILDKSETELFTGETEKGQNQGATIEEIFKKRISSMQLESERVKILESMNEQYLNQANEILNTE